jgi:hypothetical protein
MVKKARQGTRFRLLIYKRMWQRWAWPCLLIIPASIALWWFAPRIAIVHTPLRFLALAIGLVALLILCYAYLARKLAWVQCRKNLLRIQTPLYPLAISYGRIKATHPAPFSQIFDPAEEKPARRAWLRPYWAKTALVVDLYQYPLKKFWLRLWLSPYLFTPGKPGFVFLVEDWMKLSRQLDDYRTQYQARRATRREQTIGENIPYF